MQDYGVIRKAPGRPHAFTSGGSEGYGRAVDHQPVLKACVGTHAKGHTRRATREGPLAQRGRPAGSDTYVHFTTEFSGGSL